MLIIGFLTGNQILVYSILDHDVNQGKGLKKKQQKEVLYEYSGNLSILS